MDPKRHDRHVVHHSILRRLQRLDRQLREQAARRLRFLPQPSSERVHRSGEELASLSLSEGQLGQQITAGVNALGNVLTSIPALYNNVKQLGEAWDKPNKSTEDYMNLMASLGGVVMGVGQVIQAFSAIQEIATAVQAAFNAVAALNPYVLLAIAVIALIAGIVLLIVYWDKVKAAIRDNPWIAVIAVR